MENLRPTFLTILCVLTFVGSAFGIYSAITNYTSAEVATGLTKDMVGDLEDKIDNESQDEKSAELVKKMMGSVASNLTESNIKNVALGSGISNILTLLGAIFMWSLQKRGFWVYVVGALVGIATPLMVYSGFLGAVTGGGMAFISIIMCVLYFVNYKHLTN